MQLHSVTEEQSRGTEGIKLSTAVRGKNGKEKNIIFQSSESYIAALAMAGIATHLWFRYGLRTSTLAAQFPLHAVLLIGGVPLVWRLCRKLIARDFGSDLLAGISILTSVLLGQYLVGSIVVLMLSGGAALEHLATRRASAVLDALASRMPQTAHRELDSRLLDISLDAVAIGDRLVVLPHEICPVDGIVIEGHGVMDESYLTGEPFRISKGPGSHVMSGAVNQDMALTIRAEKLAVDSRYAKIMQVMHESEQNRPHLRRLGDQLGFWYAPVAVSIALAAWFASGDPLRFLAVMVVATPCPLLIAIPVAVIGAISLAARRGIIIKNPAVLEQITSCRTLILDKTGTLTLGKPKLTQVQCMPAFSEEHALRAAASLEQYSKHPLASAILEAARAAELSLSSASDINEKPGEGLFGVVEGEDVQITGRGKVHAQKLITLPPNAGLECIVLINGAVAAVFRFHDSPRAESAPFVRHLKPMHNVNRVLLVSGDRLDEVKYLANLVGIEEIYAEKSPEEKVSIVREEVRRQKTAFVGDGINDAPALLAATVGVAFGQNSDITSEAADAVVMSASIAKIDELIHIGLRMRTIALQSAVGGMVLSIAGMIAASLGWLPALEGAIVQEVIDLAAVLNAVRVALPTQDLTDF